MNRAGGSDMRGATLLGINKLLVGVALMRSEEDPDQLIVSPATRDAVVMALRVAAVPGGEVTLFTVNEDSPGAEDERGALNVQQILEVLIDEAARHNVRARSVVASGSPWMDMIREVRRNGHQMVLVGSRNPTRRRRLFLGSTAIKLLRKCPCPVWAVRPETESAVKTIVVADELSNVGQRCVELGVSAAQLLDARLLVLHAAEYTLEGHLRRKGASPREIEAYREKKRSAAEQILHEHLSMTDYRTITHGTQVQVIGGPPDVVIEEALAEYQADVLVMGTLARGGIPGLLVGNTAERLLPVINCSLIAVKPDDFFCPIPLD
jgi:universal stress protein E